MKLNKLIYLLPIALTAGLWSCSSEEQEVLEPGNEGRTIQITVNAMRPGDNEDTRTSMGDNGGSDLSCVWTEGDKLLVTDASGVKKGILELTGGKNTDHGTFTGELSNVTDGEAAFNFIYLGTAWSQNAVQNDGLVTDDNGITTFTADYSNQDGTLSNLTKNDILAKSQTVNVSNKNVVFVENLNLDRLISFAKFKVSSLKEYKSNLNYDELGYIVVDGDGLVNKISVNVANLSVTPVMGSIDVHKKISAADDEFYMVLLPGHATPFDIKVSVSDGNDVYTGKFAAAKVISAGKYYRKDNADNSYEGLPLTDWTTAKNPGNMDNWGVSQNLMPEYKKLSSSPSFVLINDGWTVNTDLYGNGGFGTWIEYLHNGIAKSGLMFSDSYGTAYYYQWGRWFGFPPTAYNWHVNSGGSWRRNLGTPSDILGVSAYNDGNKSSYIWDKYEWGFFYQSCYFSNLSKEKADRFALIYACVDKSSNTMDYMQDNSDYNWEDRSGNPCPDNYRLPNAYDLAILIPNETTSIGGSHAEVKTVNGVKFAMKWVVNTNTNPYRLEICSVKTDKSSVSITDDIFNSAPVIYLHAFGYMDWDGVLKSKGVKGAYWSNASGKLSDRNANGGKYLEINFNGSSVTMSMNVTYRSMGLCVLPIKDDNSKSATITPWFPIP